MITNTRILKHWKQGKRFKTKTEFYLKDDESVKLIRKVDKNGKETYLITENKIASKIPLNYDPCSGEQLIATEKNHDETLKLFDTIISKQEREMVDISECVEGIQIVGNNYLPKVVLDTQLGDIYIVHKDNISRVDGLKIAKKLKGENK